MAVLYGFQVVTGGIEQAHEHEHGNAHVAFCKPLLFVAPGPQF